MSENTRLNMVRNWIAVMDAFRASVRTVTEKPLTQSEQFSQADSWESLFQVAEFATAKRDAKSLDREKSDRAARLAGVCDSTGTRAKFRVKDVQGFAEFSARVDTLTGAITCGPIAIFNRTTKAHAEREMRQGKTVYSDESGYYVRFNIRGTWGVTSDNVVKIWNDESETWQNAEPSPATVMASRMEKWVPVV